MANKTINTTNCIYWIKDLVSETNSEQATEKATPTLLHLQNVLSYENARILF